MGSTVDPWLLYCGRGGVTLLPTSVSPTRDSTDVWCTDCDCVYVKAVGPGEGRSLSEMFIFSWAAVCWQMRTEDRLALLQNKHSGGGFTWSGPPAWRGRVMYGNRKLVK